MATSQRRWFGALASVRVSLDMAYLRVAHPVKRIMLPENASYALLSTQRVTKRSIYEHI